MKFANAADFRAWEFKSITLMGMSGVGKTTLAAKIPKRTWFHYSVDYRIGTKYLAEPIHDEIKRHAMRDPFLAELLRTDSIYIRSNLTVDNLTPLSTFLGKLGDPDKGGLPLEEFKRRQHLHRDAEINALRDVVEFIHKARSIYGYQNFINDAGGSICEIDDPATLDLLNEHTLLVYIKSSPELEQTLIKRARTHPKPLYYQASFLDEKLALFMREYNLQTSFEVDPDDFVKWIFPHLLQHRLPRYQAIADRYGYSIDYRAVAEIQNDDDFIELIAATIDQQ
ncbi:MAG: ATPase [Candidatus Competibacteraceae bacterium]|nr:ATPase [Candidatus Competibacteraceae bacterium]MCB1805876.1 ATPase [Candidatus Competibacteraceae bacterium]MCB1811155.1 ATPase [Candidatus Competibacteraceae bacterium]